MSLCVSSDSSGSLELEGCVTQQDKKGKKANCNWCGTSYFNFCSSGDCGPNAMTVCSARDFGDNACPKDGLSLGTCSPKSIQNVKDAFGDTCFTGNKKLCCRWHDCGKYCAGPQTCAERVQELIDSEKYPCEEAVKKVREECPMGDCDACDSHSCECGKYCSGPQSCSERVQELINFEEYSCEKALDRVRKECPKGNCDSCGPNSCRSHSI